MAARAPRHHLDPVLVSLIPSPADEISQLKVKMEKVVKDIVKTTTWMFSGISILAALLNFGVHCKIWWVIFAVTLFPVLYCIHNLSSNYIVLWRLRSEALKSEVKVYKDAVQPVDDAGTQSLINEMQGAIEICLPQANVNPQIPTEDQTGEMQQVRIPTEEQSGEIQEGRIPTEDETGEIQERRIPTEEQAGEIQEQIDKQTKSEVHQEGGTHLWFPKPTEGTEVWLATTRFGFISLLIFTLAAVVLDSAVLLIGSTIVSCGSP